MEKLLLRPVIDFDLPLFFIHQADAEAARKAAFPSRTEEAFYTHWHKIMADPQNILRTIVLEDQVAGNMVSFEMDGKREVGYWLGREFWGQGIASLALGLFLQEVRTRPLYAHVAKTNPASMRVLEKGGFILQNNLENELIYLLD
jgi:RimJ/RimL family protein N-acetyltransferase